MIVFNSKDFKCHFPFFNSSCQGKVFRRLPQIGGAFYCYNPELEWFYDRKIPTTIIMLCVITSRLIMSAFECGTASGHLVYLLSSGDILCEPTSQLHTFPIISSPHPWEYTTFNRLLFLYIHTFSITTALRFTQAKQISYLM